MQVMNSMLCASMCLMQVTNIINFIILRCMFRSVADHSIRALHSINFNLSEDQILIIMHTKREQHTRTQVDLNGGVVRVIDSLRDFISPDESKQIARSTT